MQLQNALLIVSLCEQADNRAHRHVSSLDTCLTCHGSWVDGDSIKRFHNDKTDHESR